jgi:hypothetical protein
MKRISALLLAVLLLAGCSTHITDLSVISNKSVDLGSINLDKSTQVKNVVGDDTKFIFLFIPFGQPRLQEALNDAFRKSDGDLMIDASVHHKGWWFLVGESTIEIQGTVVKTRGK